VTRIATTQLIADQLSSSNNRNLLAFLEPKLDLKISLRPSFSRIFYTQKVIEAWKDCKTQKEEKGRLNHSSQLKLI
jgi:hypothetical protein